MNNNKRKTFCEVKPGDTIYTLSYNQAKVVIYKHIVTYTKVWTEISVRIGYGKASEANFIASNDKSRLVHSWDFSKWVATTTLEEAKNICREITQSRIKTIKSEIRSLNNKIKKWEDFEKSINEGNFIIK